MEGLNFPQTKWHLLTLLVAVGYSCFAYSALADQSYGSICDTISIRGPWDFAKLDNCRVVEGNVSVGPIEHSGTFQKSFPNLVEITDVLVLFRVEGLRSLGQLFPNLAVIGGQTLLSGYAFVAYELFDLEDIGLPNLTVIRNGAVRIEKNPRLCYIDTVDWSRITKDEFIDENYFKSNNDYCANICPSQCDHTEGVKRCWNAEHCQIMLSCPPECKFGYCHGDVCCHSNCIGGCSGPLASQCTSCNAVVHSTNTDGETCLPSCPTGLFKYKNRRCLTADECINFVDYGRVVPDSESNKDPLCTKGCPAGYLLDGDETTKCVPCKNGKCPKVCSGRMIESLDAAEDFKDCTIIDGNLKLRIKHCVDEEKIEEYLGNITEVTGWLDISYSYGLHSLRLFRRLRKLGGQQLIEEKYVLRVYHNPNLQELFPEESLSGHGSVKGSVLFQHNGKLNYSKILEFLSKAGIYHNVDDEDVSIHTNGDKLSKSMPKLQLRLMKASQHLVFVNWQPLTFVKSNYFIGYSLHWKEVPHTSVTVFDKADACTDIGWRRKYKDCPINSCNDEKLKYVSGLSPWTRYAMYVRAFTLANDDVVSNVLYFRSLAAVPSGPINVHVEAKTPGTLQLTWDPPVQTNGNGTEYIITRRHIPIRQEEHSLRDYCTNPLHEDKDEKLVKSAGKTECCLCHEHSKDFLQYFQFVLQNSIFKRLENTQHTSTPAYVQEPHRSTVDVMSENTQHTSTPAYVQEPHRSTVDVVSEEQFTATNLENYQVYSFEVRACVNGLRDIDTVCGASTFVSGRTSPDEMADTIPSVSLEGVTNGIKVKWQDPTSPNGIILKYEIKYSAANMEQPEVLCIPYHNASENQFTVSQLKPGDYKFWVRAASLAGFGPWTPYFEYHLEEPFECYHWTSDDIWSFKLFFTKQKTRCENVLGHVFTQGNNENFPGCASCWCCKRKYKF